MTTAGAAIASLYGILSLRDEATPKLRQFDNQISGAADRLDRLAGRATTAGQVLAPVSAGLLAVGTMAVRTASQYEDALKQIEVRASATSSEMAQIDAVARQLSAESVFGPAAVADGMLQLMAAGQSANEALATIPAVLNGAAATGANMAQVGNSLTNTMNAFGLSVEYADDTLQHMVASTGTSSNTFSDVSAAFANVGGMARSMGLDVEQTAATFAVFANTGIEGAEAGTQLRSMLVNLTRETDDVQRAWADLGVSMYDSNGAVRDLNDVFQDLNVAMADMTDEERNRYIQTLAGSYGRLGFEALLAADGTEAMVSEMRRQAAVAAIADARLDTFSGAVAFLKGSLDLLMIEAMQPLMDSHLTPMVRQLGDVTNAVTGWMTENPVLAGQIVKLGAVLAVASPALFAFAATVKAMAFTVSALGVAFGVLTSPVVLAGAAIAAFAVAYQRNLYGVRDTTDDVLSWMSGKYEQVRGAVVDTVEAVLERVRSLGDLSLTLPETVVNFDLAAVAGRVGAQLDEAIGMAVGKTAGDIGGLQGYALALPAGTFALEKPSIAADIQLSVEDAINLGLGAAAIAFGGPVGIGVGLAKAVGYAISTDFMGLATWMENAGLPTTLGGAYERLRGWIADGFRITSPDLSFDFGAYVQGSIVTPLQTAVENLDLGMVFQGGVNFAADMVNGLAGALDSVDTSTVQDAITGLLDTALAGVRTSLDLVAWVGENIVAPIGSALLTTDFTPLVEGTSRLAGEIFQKMLEALPVIPMWTYENIISPIFGAFTTFDFESASEQISAFVTNTFTWLMTSLPNFPVWVNTHIITPFFDALGGLPGQLVDFFNDAIPDELNIDFPEVTIPGTGVGLIPPMKIGGGTLSFDLPDNPIPGGTRRSGGPVMVGVPYQVGEGDVPEMYEQNGKMYLIPGDQGRVTPMGGGGNTYNITINSYGESAYELADMVERALRDKGIQ